MKWFRELFPSRVLVRNLKRLVDSQHDTIVELMNCNSQIGWDLKVAQDTIRRLKVRESDLEYQLKYQKEEHASKS